MNAIFYLLRTGCQWRLLPREFPERVKGRKRHILVDTFGLLIACRVEPADISDRKAAALLLGGLRPLFPNIRTVIADAGKVPSSRTTCCAKTAGSCRSSNAGSARSRSQASHGLWSAASLGLATIDSLSKDYEYSVQSSENLSENAQASLRSMRWIMAILIQASLVRGLIS